MKSSHFFCCRTSSFNALTRTLAALAYTGLMLNTFGQNLIQNGDFEAGNTGFSNEYTFTTSPLAPQTYCVASNPLSVHPLWPSMGDHTSGSGLMLVVNGALFPGSVIWSETVSVAANTTYTFSAWAADLFDPYTQFGFFVNGVQQGSPVSMPAPWSVWRRASASWNSGTATTAVLEIRILTDRFVMNDLALDDLAFIAGGAPPPPPLEIDAPEPGIGTVGEDYSYQVYPRGGTPPYQWSLANGSAPPPGLLFLDGILAGIPTADGLFFCTTQLQDANGSVVQQKVYILIEKAEEPPPAPLQVAIDTLQDINTGIDYFFPLIAIGGKLPYKWELHRASCNLLGLQLHDSGLLTGVLASSGERLFSTRNCSLTVFVHDSEGRVAEGILDVVVDRDTDGDGIPDYWEHNPIDIDHDGQIEIDLRGMADPERADIFVEVDYIPDCKPLPESLADVVRAFDIAPVNINKPGLKPGVKLHVPMDSAEELPKSERLRFKTHDPGPNDDFDDLKLGAKGDGSDGYFGTKTERAKANWLQVRKAKKNVYRYCIFALAQSDNPDSSGIAEFGGNDFMISVGDFSDEAIGGSGWRQAVEAGTFMHELGHTLGLLHGGGDEINHKPNYLSVMNYSFQFPNFVTSRPLDYSSSPKSEASSLNEDKGLSEPIGIVGPAGRFTVYAHLGSWKVVECGRPIQWNEDPDTDDSGVSADVNWLPAPNAEERDHGLQTLDNFDDWGNLRFDFRDSFGFADGSPRTDDEIVTERSIYDLLAEALKADEDEDGVPNVVVNLVGQRGMYKNHGAYVSAVAMACASLVTVGSLDEATAESIVSAAARKHR